eukprot:5016315-Pleurochrysis_carterae.AAC.1
MVSCHHAYQALNRGIARRLLPEPAQAAYDFMSVAEQPLTTYELQHRFRLPPCHGMATSLMPIPAAPCSAPAMPPPAQALPAP